MMYMKTDKELLDDFQKRRNLKPSSMRQYKTALKRYSEYNNNMPLVDLLNEAEFEEDERIPQRRRKLTSRLLGFRNHVTEHYKKNTVKSIMTKTLTLYTTYGLEIPKLPRQSEKNMNDCPPISFKDLPDKDIIKASLRISNPLMNAIILFMSSSGSARTEMLNLTVQDFIDSTQLYHDSNDIYEVLDILKERDDVVPTFKIKRQKTDKWYYTFCSPEAVTAIVNYLLTIKKPLHNEDVLFQYHEVTVCYKFQEINDELGLGKKGTYNRFRSHMLRKFHASNLKNHGMSKEDINEMQGKGQNLVDEAYFFDDPNILREKYIEHMDAVTINLDVNNIDIKSQEYLELEQKLKEKEAEVKEIDDRILNIEERLFEIDKQKHSRETILDTISEL
ncbi:site-specific integrase [uncultured Methanobrevibacter sp.]|uniref:site-specific integrase n=1 Tax=uncultured Methanobrevibacter sp. TaxID=253161 RepID=UPI0025D65B08|nr:site-specific integrase [uncultured Methanobrevibacter sp.]